MDLSVEFGGADGPSHAIIRIETGPTRAGATTGGFRIGAIGRALTRGWGIVHVVVVDRLLRVYPDGATPTQNQHSQSQPISPISKAVVDAIHGDLPADGA